jgi:hypothetical protein
MPAGRLRPTVYRGNLRSDFPQNLKLGKPDVKRVAEFWRIGISSFIKTYAVINTHQECCEGFLHDG